MGECRVRMGFKSVQIEVRNCGLLSQTSMLHLYGFNYMHIPHLNAFRCHGRLSTGVVAAKVQNNTNHGKMGRAYAVSKYMYGIIHAFTRTHTHTRTRTHPHRQKCIGKHACTHAHTYTRTHMHTHSKHIPPASKPSL